MVAAKDLAPYGVRVNTICPGMVQTPLNRGVWQSWIDKQPADKKLTYDEWGLAKVRQMCPLGRWQTQRGEGSPHQLRHVRGQGSRPLRRPSEHDLPGHGANTAQSRRVAIVDR